MERAASPAEHAKAAKAEAKAKAKKGGGWLTAKDTAVAKEKVSINCDHYL